MASEQAKSGRTGKRGWLYHTVMVAMTLALGLAFGRFVLPGLKVHELDKTWEELFALALGTGMLIMVPIALLRWFMAPQMRMSGGLVMPMITMALGGVSLLVIVLGPGMIGVPAAFGLSVVILIASLVTNWLTLKRMDELMKRLNSEASEKTFFIGSSALVIYAAAEYMGLVQPVSALGLLCIVTVLSWAAAMWAYYKYGLGPESQKE
jgi:hypothetical protein